MPKWSLTKPEFDCGLPNLALSFRTWGYREIYINSLLSLKSYLHLALFYVKSGHIYLYIQTCSRFLSSREHQYSEVCSADERPEKQSESQYGELNQT